MGCRCGVPVRAVGAVAVSFALVACGTQAGPPPAGPGPGAPFGLSAPVPAPAPTGEPAASTPPAPSTGPSGPGAVPPLVGDRSVPALTAVAIRYMTAVNAHDLPGAVSVTCAEDRDPDLPPDVQAGTMFPYTQGTGVTWTLKDVRIDPDHAHASVDYQGPRGADDVWDDDFAYAGGWCHRT